MQPRRRFFSARDGLRLSALEWEGPPHGRTPLLCLPGLARTALDYAALASRQSGRRRVVALDYAGHGESERPASIARYSLDHAVRDLLDAMAALHLHRVALVGTSFGGILGMALGVLRPAGLAAVALNDVGPRLEAKGVEIVRDIIGRDPAFGTLEEATAFLRRRLPPLHAAEEDWPALAGRTYAWGEDGRLHPRWDPRIAEVMAERDSLPEDLWPAFRALAHVPLLLVWGQESELLSPGTVRMMRQARPDMEVVSLPGVGHAPLLDEPVSLAALDRFLDALP